MISISPNSHLQSSEKHVIWRKFVLAHTGVEKLCLQLDGYMRCWRLRSPSWRLQALEGGATHEDGHGDVALQPGPAAGRTPADDNSRDQGRHENHSTNQEIKRS